MIWLTEEQKRVAAEFLADQQRRLNSLYWIIDKDGKPRRFRMNWAQEELHRGAHTRNAILKVRQLGISTYVILLTLDYCLFNSNFHAAIVDKKFDDACEKIDKIAFAYEHLDYVPPDATPEDYELAKLGRIIKDHFGREREDGRVREAVAKRDRMEFSNGSSVQASTSGRGGTLQLLHVSELGYISVHDPIRAKEIVTGSFNTVGKNCRIFAESTHEGGQFGHNYELITAAMDNTGKEMTSLDFKFFFFPWWRHPEYRLRRAKATETAEERAYFDALEKQTGEAIGEEQREWYVTMKKTQGVLMRQEYPSTPGEALNPLPQGAIYLEQLIGLRERGHYAAQFEHDPHRPIYTAWDLGVGDYTAIWWIQPTGGGAWMVLDCYTANSKAIAHYIDVLRERDARWGRCACCVTPHDVTRRDLNLLSYADSLRAAGYSVTRVPATANFWLSIDNTRQLLDTCIFHERCSSASVCDGRRYLSGMDALSNYRMAPPGAHGNLARQALHDEASHAADALRTFADAVKLGYIGKDLAYQAGVQNKESRSFIDSFLTI